MRTGRWRRWAPLGATFRAGLLAGRTVVAGGAGAGTGRATARSTARSAGASPPPRPGPPPGRDPAWGEAVAARPTVPPAVLVSIARLNRALWYRCSRLAVAIPLPVGYWLADRVADLCLRFAHGYRRNVLANLRQVRGEHTASEKLLRAVARQTFRHSARDFYDLLRVPHLPAAAIERSIIVMGSWESAEQALARGTGVIFVTCHLGSFDYGLQLIALRGYPTIALTVPTVGRFVHDGLTHLRGSRGLRIEEATRGTSRRLREVLREGISVILASDRDFQRNGVPVCFFAWRTTLPNGAVRLAWETGAPLVMIVCRRHGLRQTMTIEDPIWVMRSRDGEADQRRGLEEVVATLERHIGATPEQWVMFQRVWP